MIEFKISFMWIRYGGSPHDGRKRRQFQTLSRASFEIGSDPRPIGKCQQSSRLAEPISVSRFQFVGQWTQRRHFFRQDTQLQPSPSANPRVSLGHSTWFPLNSFWYLSNQEWEEQYPRMGFQQSVGRGVRPWLCQTETRRAIRDRWPSLSIQRCRLRWLQRLHTHGLLGAFTGHSTSI